MREPIVAGQFYEYDKKALEGQIKSCFEHKFGPGDLPAKKKKGRIKGIIAPHAGYMFSGMCQAWSYKEISESELPDLFVILGTSHQGFPTSTMIDDWKTPLGIVKTDKDFAKKLIKNGIENNPDAHLEEHSIEVQLPFLQFVLKDQEINFVPVIIGHNNAIKDAEMIKKTITETKKKVCIIVSSDFTHYGYNYGHVPFTENVKENLYALDKGAIDLIKKTDAKGFLDYCKKKGATICGQNAIAALLEILKGSKVELLKYYTSGDVAGDYNNAVGYAAVIFK